MTKAMIIAAKRSAMGRIGGLHRSRRLHDLTAPIIAAALAEARIEPSRIETLAVGNASEGGNAARLVALAAGLPETTGAVTLDRQCASGLDAILMGMRDIEAGASEVVLAGGAESLSNAPWRVSRPRNPAHPPRFIAFGPDAGADDGGAEHFAAFDQAAQRLGISRAEQDQWAFQSFEKATAAREAGEFLSEIVPQRHNAEEMRDQPSLEIALDDIESETPFAPPSGTATPGNTSVLCDGTAFAVIVSERIWRELGTPPALVHVASAVEGVRPGEEAAAAAAAVAKLYARRPEVARESLGAVELNERTAGEAIGFMKSLGIAPAVLNPSGGAIARGHPYGAAGAVLVTRLFTRMIRGTGAASGATGLAAVGAFGGQGVAALFTRT